MVALRPAAPAVAACALVAVVAWFGSDLVNSPRSVQAASTAVAGSTALVAAEPLTTGCNQITRTGLPVGSKVGDWVNQNIQPASAVLSVWHFNNTSQSYQNAFFKDPNAPVDAPTFQLAVDSFFVCVNAAATAA